MIISLNCVEPQIYHSEPPRRQPEPQPEQAALVATEIHFWLTLSQISDKDRVFQLDTPILPSGLFGDTVNSVVDRFQEAKKQAAAYQQFLPDCSQSGADRRCSSSKSSREMTDLRTVIFKKKALAKRS